MVGGMVYPNNLSGPTLTVITDGTTVTLSWASISNANGYTVFYPTYQNNIVIYGVYS